MTFTCNQFDNPIVLAITKYRNISDCEKIDPYQIYHTINVGLFWNVDPYEEDARARFLYCKKRTLDEVVQHNIKKTKEMGKIVDDLHVVLNTIRTNFFTESIICQISNTNGCGFMTRDDLGINNSSLHDGWTCYSFNGGMFFVEYYGYGYRYDFFSHKCYNRDDLMKLDLLNFYRENWHDEKIFYKSKAY